MNNSNWKQSILKVINQSGVLSLEQQQYFLEKLENTDDQESFCRELDTTLAISVDKQTKNIELIFSNLGKSVKILDAELEKNKKRILSELGKELKESEDRAKVWSNHYKKMGALIVDYDNKLKDLSAKLVLDL